ncbi:hypothetical protein Taro_001765 [Colocasia esculenta]|uniref:BED-type domain-containing protein n=1 Tax=Colocasia esculenta TaxID=4460 RepID=A0A843TEI8_COLES|nr:hypothetical protein [Colocasia esculenta]
MARRKVQCKYCNRVLSGGIFRLKQHLAGIKGEVAPCSRVSAEVRIQFCQYMNEKETSKANISRRRQEIREELSAPPRRSVDLPRGRQTIDLDDDEEGELDDVPLLPEFETPPAPKRQKKTVGARGRSKKHGISIADLETIKEDIDDETPEPSDNVVYETSNDSTSKTRGRSSPLYLGQTRSGSARLGRAGVGIGRSDRFGADRSDPDPRVLEPWL